MQYVVLIRGINVGGKNKVSMAELTRQLDAAGLAAVRTYINSGNVLLESDLSATKVGSLVEAVLLKHFASDGLPIRVLVLTLAQLERVVAAKPAGFGEQPQVYYSDVIFLMDISTSEALKVFRPREGVDTIWPGDGVIYSQRLGELRTKSRLNRIVGTPAYASMTIRTWNTVNKLLDLTVVK